MAAPSVDQLAKNARPPARPRPVRLWPLLFLPVLGTFVGLVLGRDSQSIIPSMMDSKVSAAFGLIAGCCVMMITASLVLVRRLASKRYTIATILIQIAVAALFFGMVRAIFF